MSDAKTPPMRQALRCARLLREVLEEKQLLPTEELDRVLDPEAMTKPL